MPTIGGTMTGQLLSAVGTAGAPGIAGAGDADTGMNWPAANTLAWSTGGVEGMRLDTSGNVGIGTTAPAVKLDVLGIIRAVSTGNTMSVVLAPDASLAAIQASYSTGSVYPPMAFFTSGSERMRLDTSGNVGINTTAPLAKLEVYQTGQSVGAEGSGSLLLSNAVARRLELGYDNTTDAGFIRAYHAGTAHKAIVINPSGGNVGIGTSSPAYKFHVGGNFGIAPGVGTTVTPANNADLVIETTSNTTLTFKLKGSDGVVRTGTVALA